MKVKILAGIGVAILVGALIVVMKPKSFEEKFLDTMQGIESYILQGNMEVLKGEDTKSYVIEVGYQKGDTDKFRVSLKDQDLDQEQIILRNDEGVFVVTPSLNQIFQFEGDWPLNTPKPYLLQTITDIVQQEDATIEKQDDGYLVEASVSYPGNESFDHEQIFFDSDGKIEWLQIFNSDNTAELKIVFSEVEYDAVMDEDYFTTPTVLESTASTQIVEEEDLPLYPVKVFSSQLTNVNSMQVNGQTRYILEYTGEKNFTVVETLTQESDTTQTVIMPGEMIDVLDVIGVYDGNHLSAVYNQIEFSVYSDDLSPEEMMQVIQSMQVAVMK